MKREYPGIHKLLPNRSHLLATSGKTRGIGLILGGDVDNYV